jgi:hypothetical protein
MIITTQFAVQVEVHLTHCPEMGFVKLRCYRSCKLHQAGFDTQMVLVNLPKVMKSVMLDEEMAISNPANTRSKMMLRAGRR